jgi:protein-S-isoprenylcysteine O-methyltransferase Ste14
MLVATLLLFGLLLFLPAGNLTWEKGWLFLLVFVTLSIVILLYIWCANPELLVARSRLRWAKGWDMIVSSITIAALLAIFPVAALDDERFHWCPQPWWVCCLGYFLFLVGMGVLTWVGAVNKFAEPAVRIQVERGHKVIDTGPYAIVRHPSYAVAVPFFAGIALCLGSLWALIPAGLASAMLVLRTQWEDQTLQAELKGYKEYTGRVRYKLIPGVW